MVRLTMLSPTLKIIDSSSSNAVSLGGKKSENRVDNRLMAIHIGRQTRKTRNNVANQKFSGRIRCEWVSVYSGSVSVAARAMGWISAHTGTRQCTQHGNKKKKKQRQTNNSEHRLPARRTALDEYGSSHDGQHTRTRHTPTQSRRVSS